MKTILLTMTMLIVLTSVAFAQSVERGEGGNSSVIVVSGEGQIRVPPDQATVRIGIQRQAASAQAAQDQANTVANDILAAITKAGIAANDIQTSRLTLSFVYAPRGPDASQEPRIVAYQASNDVAVRLTDLNKVGAVIDAGLRSGTNEIQGVQFGLRDDLAARQQALKQAVSEAQRKAETIADAVHVQLGAPVEIAEQGVSVMPRGEFTPALGMARAE